MRAAARNRIETVECHGALWDSSSMYERADEVSFCRYFESCWYLTFFLSASWEPTTLRSCLHLERSDPLRLRCFVTFRDIVILIQYILIYHILCIRIFTYIYILVSGMVPMPSYVLNFMQQIWGATLVKTCIHIYIYIMKSTFSWMILNDPQRQRLNLCFQRFIVRPCYGCVMKHPLTQGEQRWCTMTRSMPRRLLLANCDVRKVGRVKLCVCNLPRVLTLQSYCHEHSHQLTL